MISYPRVLGFLVALALLPAIALAGEGAYDPLPSPMTLEVAVEFALAHHPRLRAESAREEGAAAKLDLARAHYWPRGDIAFQENRATGNVVPGTQFAIPGIPAISGPPRDRVFDSGVWGSAASLTLSYDVAHLTQQIARVDAALADSRGAQAGLEAERLAIASAAAEAFIITLRDEQLVNAASASVRRDTVFAEGVNALVSSGLRPGADAARASAELSLARTVLIRTQQEDAVSRAELAQALGAAGQTVSVIAGKLLRPPPAGPSEQTRSARNPVIRAADAAVRAARSRQRAAKLEYIPRVEIAGALWGRANGLFPGGAKLGFSQGLVPDTPNWAAGVVVTIPILQFPEIRARSDLAAADAKVAAAQREEAVQQVRAQVDSARAILAGAYRIANEAHTALVSSQAAVNQAEARYRAGLYTVDPAAEALRLLTQAEADDAIARVGVWRAKLLLARAVGDIGLLLDETREASTGVH